MTYNTTIQQYSVAEEDYGGGHYFLLIENKRPDVIELAKSQYVQKPSRILFKLAKINCHRLKFSGKRDWDRRGVFSEHNFCCVFSEFAVPIELYQFRFEISMYQERRRQELQDLETHLVRQYNNKYVTLSHSRTTGSRDSSRTSKQQKVRFFILLKNYREKILPNLNK